MNDVNDVLGQRYQIADGGEAFVVFSRGSDPSDGRMGLIIKWDENKSPNFVSLDSFRTWLREGVVRRVT